MKIKTSAGLSKLLYTCPEEHFEKFLFRISVVRNLYWNFEQELWLFAETFGVFFKTAKYDSGGNFPGLFSFLWNFNFFNNSWTVTKNFWSQSKISDAFVKTALYVSRRTLCGCWLPLRKNSFWNDFDVWARSFWQGCQNCVHLVRSIFCRKIIVGKKTFSTHFLTLG